MKTFTVLVEKLVEHKFELKANSFTSVADEFERLANESKLDFSCGHPISCRIVSVRCYEANREEKRADSYSDLLRFAEQFKTYIANDEEAAASQDYIYTALTSAGCDEEDIKALGFGHCIPEEEEV